MAAIEAARQAAEMRQPVPDAALGVSQPALARATRENSPSAYQVEPYSKVRLPRVASNQALHTVDPNHLAQAIKAVVDVEAPVHELEATRRLTESYGLSRAGNRIAAHVSKAIKIGISAGLFFYADGFLYTDRQREAKIRNRERLEASERKIEWVAPEEIDAALLEVVRLGFSMDAEAAIAGALEMLGFGRVTSRMKELVNARIDNLIDTNRLVRIDAMLSVM